MIHRVYKIKPQNHWPYEAAISVSLHDESAFVPVELDGDDARYRIYRRHPTQYIEWSFVEVDFFFEENPLDCLLLEGVPAEPWLQTSMSLFCSDHRRDDSQLAPLRERLKGARIEALLLPPNLQLESVFVEGGPGNPADPADERRLDGRFERRRVCELYVSDVKQRTCPIINGHTIPDAMAPEFEFVMAKVATFAPIDSLPRVGELVEVAHRWGSWFDGEFGILRKTSHE